MIFLFWFSGQPPPLPPPPEQTEDTVCIAREPRFAKGRRHPYFRRKWSDPNNIGEVKDRAPELPIEVVYEEDGRVEIYPVEEYIPPKDPVSSAILISDLKEPDAIDERAIRDTIDAVGKRTKSPRRATTTNRPKLRNAVAATTENLANVRPPDTTLIVDAAKPDELTDDQKKMVMAALKKIFEMSEA